MLHILIGGAGCGKSTCLIQHLQKQLKAGEQILTLVPEQFSYEFDQIPAVRLRAGRQDQCGRTDKNGTAVSGGVAGFGTGEKIAAVGKTVPAGFVYQRIGNDVYPVSPQRNPAGTAVQFQCGTERQIAGKDAGRV